MKNVKKAALMALGVAISALVYTDVGLMMVVALLAALFVVLALKGQKGDQSRGL